MLPTEERKGNKDSEDDKLVSSDKSAKTIKSLTKQVKSLKKLVSVSALQSHQEDSDNSKVSPAWRETRTSNMRV